MDGTLRMLDANLNRAREALRVLEDLSRFVLSDAELAKAGKDLRHAVSGACAGVEGLSLLASRDSAGDPGRTLEGAGEYTRASAGGVARAAGGRAGEALRVVEETLKLLGKGEAAREVERARYRAYDLHRAVEMALGTGEAIQPRVCVLITERLCAHHGWDEVARRALEGGADALQLREKDLPDAELLARARRLVEIARPFGALVFVNDRPDVALLAGAQGVHVGQDDLPIGAVRALAGSRLRVGVSTGNMDQAREAARAGADLCGVGPMFSTTTKHKPVLAGVAYLRQYLGEPLTARVPHLAIGGIGPENVGELAEAGCQGVAVSGAVCGSADPGGVCATLRARLEGTGTG